MRPYSYYSQLKKPKWAPPAAIFGPVWTFLYVLIAISFGKVFWMVWHNELPFIIVIPFILNLFFNFIFTYIQFKLKNNLLAAFDVVLVLVTLKLSMLAIFPYVPWVTYILIPYLLWVAFAMVLQFTITFLNR